MALGAMGTNILHPSEDVYSLLVLASAISGRCLIVLLVLRRYVSNEQYGLETELILQFFHKESLKTPLMLIKNESITLEICNG
jgi:hypothetical protein